MLRRHTIDSSNAWVYEDADEGREVTGGSEVVQDHCSSHVSVGVELPPSVVEEHDGALLLS